VRILFLDPNIDHARVLYSQTLEYVDSLWDLVHCSEIVEAEEWLERDEFDVLVVAIYQRDPKAEEYEAFLTRNKTMPIVVLSDSNDDAVHAGFVERGVQDSLLTQTANGHYVMRRSRLAVQRHKRPMRHRAERAERSRTVTTVSAANEKAEFSPDTSGQVTHGADWRLPVVDHLTLIVDDTEGQCLFDLSDSTVSRYRTCESLRAAVELLTNDAWTFDAVLTHHSVLEHGGPQQLRRLADALHDKPLLAVTSEHSDDIAVALVESGVDDCPLTEPTNQFAIERALRMATARFLYREAMQKKKADRPRVAEDTGGKTESRRVARYLCDQPLLAIPVLPTGAPDAKQIRDARTLDISLGGLGLELPLHQTVPSRSWVVGVTGQSGPDDFELHFASVVVRNVSYPPEGLRLGTSFHCPDEDLLRRENLEPHLDPATSRYATGLPESVLNQWCDVGVMRRKLIQRVLSCPECAAVLTLGAGCPGCGSAHFETGSNPHGRGRTDDPGTRAGANFDQPYHCLDCRRSGERLAEVGNCLSCRLRLPVSMAVEELIYGYHVNRLDVVGVLTSNHS